MFTVAVLRDVFVFAGMTGTEPKLPAGGLGSRTFVQGMMILRGDGHDRQLHFLESGKVRSFILGQSDQESSDNPYRPGEVFGQRSLRVGLLRSAGAVALEKLVTLSLHRRETPPHLQAHPNMAPSIIAVLSKCLHHATQFGESLDFLQARGRVATKLLELAGRYGVRLQSGPPLTKLRLTQTGLVTWVVASRETVIKVLGTFPDQNLIATDGQRHHTG